MTVDLGTGDGRAVLRAARAEPDRLALGVDANAASMHASARRAERRGSLPNALFVVSAVESLPDDLAAAADRVTIAFPWGSLLRGLAEAQGPILEGIRRISAPGAAVDVMWSVLPRDGVPGVDDPTRVEEAFRLSGFEVREVHVATAEEIEQAHSSWAKRLRAGRERPAYRLRASWPGPPASPDGQTA